MLDDVFAIQDEITQTIVATLAVRLEDAAHVRALQKNAANMSVYDYILRGRHHLARGSKDDVLKARVIFEQALELEPNDAQVHVGLAESYGAELNSNWTKDFDLAAARAFEFARKAVDLDVDPLRARVKSNGGHVYRDGPLFTLLIDFKTAGEPTYRVLREVLADYREMLVTEVDGKRQPGAISVVISGNRPMETISADQDRLCGIDGRLSDLQTKMPADLMPLISDNWRTHFRWRGEGEMPADEQEKLASAVQQAHAAGRRIRFWATPENEHFWKVLAGAGVDHINTDRLARLEKFLRTQ